MFPCWLEFLLATENYCVNRNKYSYSARAGESLCNLKVEFVNLFWRLIAVDMDWVIQSKEDRNKWKKERSFKSGWLLWKCKLEWDLSFPSPLCSASQFKKIISLFTKALQLLASLAAVCRKRNTAMFCLIENIGKNYFMIIFRFIRDGTDLCNVTCFTRLSVLWALEEELQGQRTLCSHSSWGREEKN